jgi:hypothetical protein
MKKFLVVLSLMGSSIAFAGTYIDTPPAQTPVVGVSGGQPVPVTGSFTPSGDTTVIQSATSTPWVVEGQLDGVPVAVKSGTSTPLQIEGVSGGQAIPVTGSVTTSGTATVSGTVAVSSVTDAVKVEQNATSTPWVISGAVTTSGTATVSGTVAVSGVSGDVSVAAPTTYVEAATECGTGSATSIPASPQSGRKNILIQNQGPGVIRIGLAPTASFGFQVASGASMSIDGNAALKCIAESATSTAQDIESK